MAPPSDDPPNASGSGTLADFDRPLDVDKAFRRRTKDSTGEGDLDDTRAGFVRLRRGGWDGLNALIAAKALTPHQALVVVGLLTRAGYRPERMGVVLGTDTELAELLGLHRNQLGPLGRELQRLDIMESLQRSDGQRAGLRFTREAWQWLVGGDKDVPAPPGAAARLDPPRATPDPPPATPDPPPADDVPNPFL